MVWLLKPLNTRHKFVFKSNMNRKNNLNLIFKQIINALKNLNDKFQLQAI